jgi:hypothetical protein
VLFVGFPALGVTLLLIQGVPHSGWMAAALVALFFGAAIVGRIRLLNWPCPRCGQPFFAKLWFNNEWADRCMHCRLDKWK